MFDLTFFCEQNRQEWNKAFVNNNLHRRKLNILVKTRLIFYYYYLKILTLQI
jgi:hypothetical protein